MSTDYARDCGAPRTITLAGRDFQVEKFTPRGVGDLVSFLKDQVPNPLDEAVRRMPGLPETVALRIWDQAVLAARHWPPSLDDEVGRKILSQTFEGVARLVWVCLRRHNAGFDLNAARELADQIDLSDVNRLLTLAAPEDSPGPKSQGTRKGR